ncbi:hypothetical protein MHH85_08160 [Viridibacillus sp. FSL E2-0187]|uniref:hypothetical protein n=1 Tax=Viridibacillus sp. FSL E2-0187 TaxID=2921362 RepID=UPI0030FA2AFA
MKFRKTLFVSLVMILFVISGCSNGKVDTEKYIEVQKRIGDENKYEDFKKISNNKQVQKVRDIVSNRDDWKNGEVDMERPADYNFAFQFKSDKMSAKTILYEIWLSPNKDKIEVGRLVDHVQLNEEDSTDLFGILTGEKLSDL